MSELDTNSFNFPELTEAEGLDIDAIFGKASAAADVNPFDAPEPAQQQTVLPTPNPATVPNNPNPQPATSVSAASQPAASNAGNLIEAAFQQQVENTKTGLFEKLPVFSYGSAKEEIQDTSLTFEELRIAKSEDFPELAEGKRVSWSVEYGKSTKTITDPKGTTIASVKEELERSKAFLDSLRKAKDKNPTCLVKPKVTAQSKGIASYKGVFTSLDAARVSEKVICLIPSQDGVVYEMRKTELGEFVAPKSNIAEFPRTRAGFTPALPLIPKDLMEQIISFFRSFMQNGLEYEALVHIYWDRVKKEFCIYIPDQQVTRIRITADLSRDGLPEDQFLHYADVHSHNSMPARFSSIDDVDEKATRLYIVIGRLDQYFPEISARVSCGGVFQEIDVCSVAEPLGAPFPEEWASHVVRHQCAQISCNKAHSNNEIQTVDEEMIRGLDKSIRYQLLCRLMQDCEYFLGEGRRHEEALWSGDVKTHIALVKALWSSFPLDAKPAEISYGKIEQLEKRMLKEA